MRNLAWVLSVIVVVCNFNSILTDGQFTIVFSHLIQGQLYPCGCNPDSLFGGIAKRAKIVNDLKKSKEVLVLDAGDMLFKRSKLDLSDSDRWAIDADLVLHSYSMIGCDALNVGERDLSHSLAFLLEEQKKYNLPFVSASIKKDNEFLFNPYIVKQIASVKVGIFGLTELTKEQKMDFRLEVLDASVATRYALERLRAEHCDIIVLLSDLRKEIIDSLLERFGSDIDFIVSGHFLNRTEPNQKSYKNTIMLKSGELGQEVGVLTIFTQNKTDWKYRSFKIDDELPDDPLVAQLLQKATDDALEWEEKNVFAFPIDYLGDLACAGCHMTQYKHWKTTRHADAFRTLEYKGEEMNRTCTPCHSVGFKLPGGYVSPSQIGILSNVQCENCHGMGKWHVLQRGRVYTKDKVHFMWRQNEPYTEELKSLTNTKIEYGDTLRFDENRLIKKHVPQEVCFTCHMGGQHTKPFDYRDRLSRGDCIPD